MTGSIPGRGYGRSVGSRSERDLALLSDLERVRLLDARQIERLHFADGSPLSRARSCRRTLKRLNELGFVARLQRRVGGLHAGSAGYIYSLDTLGQRAIASSGPAGGARRRRPWEPSAQFVDHILEVTELYVLLREAERTPTGIELLTFEAEPRAWRSFRNLSHQEVTLKPDAFVRIAQGDEEQLSFVEVDRGTEHTPTLRRKLAVYIDAYRCGVEQPDGEAFPNVVWIVPDPPRLAVLTRQISQLPTEQAALFSVTICQPDQQLHALINPERR